MTRRVVVVGAGLGGLRAAEQLRVAGFPGEIVVVGDEAHLPYSRPPLSKEGLAGDLAHETLAFPRKAAVADVDWRLGTTVVSADLAERTVALTEGGVLPYDGLVGATGVRARRLPLDAPLAWRHVVRTLDDAVALRRMLDERPRVVVLGAGFIGCEVAATARTLGCEVDVVDPLAVPLLRPLGPGLGGEIRRRHEERGVRFHLGRTPAGLEGDRRPRAVLFDDVPRRVEHWNVPTETARRAAKVLAADLAAEAAAAGTGPDPLDALPPFVPMPAFWSDQFDIRLQSFGLPALGADDVRLLEGDLRGECAVGYHRDGRLVGVGLLGMTGRFVHYRNLIAAGGRATADA